MTLERTLNAFLRTRKGVLWQGGFREVMQMRWVNIWGSETGAILRSEEGPFGPSRGTQKPREEKAK